MPKINLNSETLPGFAERIRALESTESRQWGTMSLAQMLAHLRITLEISLEERETTDESRAWLMPVIWFLMFEWITNWPKGKIKASAQFLDDDAEDVESERAQVLDLLGRFVERSESEPDRVVLEPMLGRISLAKWQRVHGLHTDYHLRQFDA